MLTKVPALFALSPGSAQNFVGSFRYYVIWKKFRMTCCLLEFWGEAFHAIFLDYLHNFSKPFPANRFLPKMGFALHQFSRGMFSCSPVFCVAFPRNSE